MRARAPSGDPVTSDISRSPQASCPPAKPQLTASRHDFAHALQGGYPPRSAAQSDQDCEGSSLGSNHTFTRCHNMTALNRRVPVPPVFVKTTLLLPWWTALVVVASCTGITTAGIPPEPPIEIAV
jgi:hypothetical protein